MRRATTYEEAVREWFLEAFCTIRWLWHVALFVQWFLVLPWAWHYASRASRKKSLPKSTAREMASLLTRENEWGKMLKIKITSHMILSWTFDVITWTWMLVIGFTKNGVSTSSYDYYRIPFRVSYSVVSVYGFVGWIYHGSTLQQSWKLGLFSDNYGSSGRVWCTRFVLGGLFTVIPAFIWWTRQATVKRLHMLIQRNERRSG